MVQLEIGGTVSDKVAAGEKIPITLHIRPTFHSSVQVSKIHNPNFYFSYNSNFRVE